MITQERLDELRQEAQARIRLDRTILALGVAELVDEVERLHKLVGYVQEYCGVDGRDGSRAIQAWFANERATDGQLPRRKILSIPHSAVCFFKDGNKWCCVNGDFINLQESPVGFGDTFEQALGDLHRARREAQQ